MDDVIKVLQADIIESLGMKLEYEKIVLQSMKDNHPNLQAELMVKYYDNRIRKFKEAIDILTRQKH